MKSIRLQQDKKVINAVCIGSLCSAAYLAVYFARNILGAVTPKMIEAGYSAEYIGRVSSLYFIAYAAGQLINGAVGEHVRARYMICSGLLLAGVFNLLFCFSVAEAPSAALLAYGMMGFSLAMIYGPMTKVVAENTEPVYATRCSLGYTFASFFGSPMAGVAAAALTWRGVMVSGSVFLGIMTAGCFFIFRDMERKKIITYGRYARRKEQGGGVRVLLQHGIVKFTLIAMITGVVRTTVVFWMPTYISQYLGFSSDTAALIFTAATFIISSTAFITIFIYEKPMKGNMDRTILLMFSLAGLFFFLMAVCRQPVLNMACMVLGVMASGGAATMLYSRYCPGLRDTGMVSAATGFLDFSSYVAASVSSTLFSHAITQIGWGRLIMVWCGLMAAGVLVSLPYKEFIHSYSSGIRKARCRTIFYKRQKNGDSP